MGQEQSDTTKRRGRRIKLGVFCGGIGRMRQQCAGTHTLSLSQTPHCRQWVKSGGKRKGSEKERKGKRKVREREGKARQGKGKDKGKGGGNAKGQRVLERRKQKLWKTKENRVREKEKAENKRKQPMVQKSTVCVELSIAQSLALSTEPRTAQSTQIPNDPCQCNTTAGTPSCFLSLCLL